MKMTLEDLTSILTCLQDGKPIEEYNFNTRSWKIKTSSTFDLINGLYRPYTEAEWLGEADIDTAFRTLFKKDKMQYRSIDACKRETAETYFKHGSNWQSSLHKDIEVLEDTVATLEKIAIEWKLGTEFPSNENETVWAKLRQDDNYIYTFITYADGEWQIPVDYAGYKVVFWYSMIKTDELDPEQNM